MKVIFLDFNGVLDTWENMDIVDPQNLQRLKNIVDQTGAKIVISSSVKTSYFFTGTFNVVFLHLVDSLKKANIEVVGMTPLARGRETEITMYLESHPEIENFCILDDEGEMEPYKDNFVKLPIQSAEYPNGLNDEQMNLAIAILNRKKNLDSSHILKKTYQ